MYNLYKISFFSISCIFCSTHLFGTETSYLDENHDIFSINIEQCLDIIEQNCDFNFDDKNLDELLNYNFDDKNLDEKVNFDLNSTTCISQESSFKETQNAAISNKRPNPCESKRQSRQHLTKEDQIYLYRTTKNQILELVHSQKHSKKNQKKVVNRLPLNTEQEIFSFTGLSKNQIYKWIYDRPYQQSRKDYLMLLEDITFLDIHLLSLRVSQKQKHPPTALFSHLKAHLIDQTQPLTDDQALILAIRFKLTVNDVRNWLSEKRKGTVWKKLGPLHQITIPKNQITLDFMDYLLNKSSALKKDIAQKAGVSQRELQIWLSEAKTQPQTKKRKHSSTHSSAPLFTRIKTPGSPI